MMMVHLYKKYKGWKFQRHIKKWGSKNVGYFQTFDKDWFGKNQSVLIWLCNNFILKYWFRWGLRIHNDVEWDEKIVSLEPNNYKVFLGVEGDKVELRADFRTHNKFSKRVYYAFKYVWWMAHFWDWLIADRFVPELSFGFLTLTVYPDYDGAPGATSCDGYVSRSITSESFSTIISEAGTNATDDNQWLYFARSTSSTTTNEFTTVVRGFTLYDTSSLGSCSITIAILSVFGYSKISNLGNCESHIVSSSPSSNTSLITADYSTIGSTSFASISYILVSNSSYNNFTLNSNGINNVSKTSISKFGHTSDWDIDGTFGGLWNSAQHTHIYGYSSDQTGTANDPKLVVTYTLTWPHKFIGQSAFAKAISVAIANIKSILGVE